jgi:hypothetical protein
MISFLRHTAAIVRPDYAQYLAIALYRNWLFAGLLIVGFANGIVDRVADGLARSDVAELILNTFEISAIVWVALVVAVVFLLRSDRLAATPADSVVAAVTAAAFLIPMTPLSWIALSGFAIYTLRTSLPGSYAHRGAWIMLAITVPMFWSRAAFAILSDPILKFDALLVGWVIGTEHIGNTIGFADGTGYLWIAPNCSSLVNVSLAVLCWVLFTQIFTRERPFHHGWWCVVACSAVIVINVTRLSLIGLYPEHEGLLHGLLGATVANWATLIAIVGICVLGVRYDLSTPR